MFAKKGDTTVNPQYWTFYPKVIECLHESSEKYPNGLLKKMILDQGKVGNYDIFRVGGIIESRIVVSLALAESIMRRSFYGVGLEKVRMI